MKKTVLITGASRGIGKAIAQRFAQEGYSLIINCSKSAKALMDDFEFDIKSLEPKPQKSSFSDKPQISSFDEFLNAISEAFMKALSAKKEKK